MTKAELLSTYVLPLLAAALTALAGFVGTQIKNLYRRWVDDKTKEAVVRTCVKAVEQLYRDLGRAMKGSSVKKYIITSDEQFEVHFGQAADKRRKLYNGMIKCNLHAYFKG